VNELINDRTDGEMDSAYWHEVRDYLMNMRTGKYEAKVDQFNFGL
jgi:hypothetical protein